MVGSRGVTSAGRTVGSRVSCHTILTTGKLVIVTQLEGSGVIVQGSGADCYY